ncbi:thiol:disulfide interchange protein DsbG [Halomonas pacifica]|uniref:thiol:disulfide interchange protein DsbG n=1 Tax=Bisbaumannia pacifica TaxID=77098 RepID=UPI002358E364|nr:thiol:disulfide interchange protein DsbG [Halomonas pacifica]MDC8803636.1 thiol:disulfide interchange protein DsbG [Halomonas pacifica]
MIPRALLLGTALTTIALPTGAEPLPAPIAALERQGLSIHGSFEAPGGLTGYAGSYQGRELAAYLLADGEHVIVGTLQDAAGNDLSAAPLERLVRAPQDAETWTDLEQSAWIADGDDAAERVVYVFTDTRCPYCDAFWAAARPWVEAGRVQLRHIMVGVLSSQSPREAVALLASDDPAAALADHQAGGEIAPLERLPRELEEAIYANQQLMHGLGIMATPGILYRQGELVELAQGLPDEQAMETVMGSPRPPIE